MKPKDIPITEQEEEAWREKERQISYVIMGNGFKTYVLKGGEK